jgi:hypothetical protein
MATPNWPAHNNDPYSVDGLRLQNCTPHAIILFCTEWDEDEWEERVTAYVVPPSGTVARVEMEREHLFGLSISEEAAVPVFTTRAGQVTGLPDPKPGRYLLVSRQVAEALSGRGDLVVVDDTVRDDSGRIIGARALASLATPEAREQFRRLSLGDGKFPFYD